MITILINRYNFSFSRIIAEIAIFLICTSVPLLASGTNGTSGAAFLQLGVGGRAISMGEAYTAATEDLNSIYYNPAGLGTLRYPELTVMHQELILDSRLENCTFSYPLYKGFIAGSNTSFWVPSFDKININGEKTGKVSFYNNATTVGYGISLFDFEFGMSLKYIYQRIDTFNYNSVAADFGVLKRLYLYSPFETNTRNFSIGMSIRNIGLGVSNAPLPRSISIGFSYNLTKWFAFNLDLSEDIIDTTGLYDFTYGFDESFKLKTGVEFNYKQLLFLRSGYKFNDGSSYTGGLGFNYVIGNVSFNLDTAYSYASALGSNYSVSVTFKLIPKVITVEDQKKAAEFYQMGIKSYVADDIPSAINYFNKCRDYNPYYKSVKQKIEDLELLEELKRENAASEQEKSNYR